MHKISAGEDEGEGEGLISMGSHPSTPTLTPTPTYRPTSTHAITQTVHFYLFQKNRKLYEKYKKF